MHPVTMVGVRNESPELQARQAALLAHLAHGAILDPFARFEFAFGQVPTSVTKDQQQVTLRIGRHAAARLVKLKLPWASMGKLLLVVDMAVILLVAVAFGNITTALYGIIAQVVSAYVTDAVLYGLDTAKVAYIISNFDREISEAIVQRMDRGVTILKGEGAYSGDKKRVLMCAFKQKEIVSLKELIFDVDPNAFIIVCNAHEVTGNGFKTYQKNEI